MAANALVVALIDLAGGVALLAMWLRALPALELLRVATSAGEAGRGNVFGVNVLGAGGASSRWWGERSDDFDGAWSLQSLLDNLWLRGWSGGVNVLNVGIGLLVGDAVLLLLLLGRDLSGTWEKNAWLDIVRSGSWTTESLWNRSIEFRGKIIIHVGEDILVVVLHLAVLLEDLLSAAAGTC